MLCNSCGCEMRIVGSKICVSGDTSPDTPTRVVRAQTMRCVNAHCANLKEHTIEHELAIEGQTEQKPNDGFSDEADI